MRRAFAPTMEQPIPQRIRSALLDAFWLAGARERVARYEAGQLSRVRGLLEAGDVRASAAAELREHRHGAVALTLGRQAAGLYLAALALSRDPSASPEAQDAVPRLDALVAGAALGPAPEGFAEARGVLAEADPLAFDALSPVEVAGKREALEATLAWLRDAIEARTPAELQRSAIARVGASAALAVLLSFGLVSWALTPANVALHKPVTSSSQWPGSPAPSGATNGDVESTYGVATTAEASPWVRVDLLDVYKVASITVHQRGDGHAAQGMPMCVDVSETGNDWLEIGRLSDPAQSKWTVPVGRRARFVRVRTAGNGTLAFAEVEVRGRK